MFVSNDPPAKPVAKQEKPQKDLLDDLLNIDFNQTDITPAIEPKEEPNPFSIASDNPVVEEIISSYNKPAPAETIEVNLLSLLFRSDPAKL